MNKEINKILIKVGSYSLCHPDGRLDHQQIVNLSQQVAYLAQLNKTVILVLSGAVAAGAHILNGNGSNVVNKQAAAAVGQPILMGIFQQAFKDYSIQIAQLLLTEDDLNDRRRYLNARNTLKNLISGNILPIINENDTVCTEEIRFSDNDFLAALCTKLMDVDMLVILTDSDGIAEEDPKQNPGTKYINNMSVADLRVFKQKYLEQLKNSNHISAGLGRGGLATKLEAPLMAAEYGVPTVIANSRTRQVLPRLIKGDNLGTRITPSGGRLNSWKAYIAHAMKPKAALIIDDGAVEALLKRKSSLLASGIVRVEGQFQRGDGISCCQTNGSEIARGIVEYNSSDVVRIAGKHSDDIEPTIGFRYRRGVIHRDNLVMTGNG